MSRIYKSIYFYLCCALVTLLPVFSHAAISQDPLFLTQSAAPRVLFTMSNDHQLFVKAYTDYTDINDDGHIDTSYLDTFDYYGYFDSAKCYKYNSSISKRRFEPDGLASGTNSHECSASNQWSGNWLNWSSMTRMDIVRKVLYGGKRSIDGSETVLERALLPQDVHSFAKVFTASSTSEMQKFTPYSETVITVCNMTNTKSAGATTGTLSTSSYPPLMQVAEGAYPQWAQAEVYQCGYRNDGDNLAQHGMRAHVDDRIVSDLTVRVQVCVSGSEEANCKTYGSNSKPTGLMQQYGEDSAALKMNFGLITGSYTKNTAGGVLRKNVTPFIGNGNTDDEINTSNGIFNYLDASLPSATRLSHAKGIVGTLDAIRIARRQNNSYHGRDGCTWASAYSDPPCRDWGNPLSEIYLEGLRYLSGKDSSNSSISPTAAFNTDDSSYITALQSPPSWVDPLPAAEWCADLSVITISTGLNSYDTNQLSNDISLDANAWTDSVGTAENIDGNKFYIGEGSTVQNQQCTPKTLTNLSDAKGLCPEIPTGEGGFNIAGMAYYAKTNDIRPDITPTGGDADQTVTTYAIALAESLPKIEIPLSNGKSITILPACTNNNMLCSLTDMTVVSMNAAGTKGDIDISWEDQPWGSDYDMDAISNITFCAESACPVNPGVGKVVILTEVRQAVTGATISMGYQVSGSTNDGTFLPLYKKGGSPRQDYSYVTPAPIGNPAYGNILTDVQIYTQGSSGLGSFLENPLWYTAKYGAFEDNDSDGTPIESDNSEWDKDGDGTPDGFFNARNPAKLFSSLDTILQNIVAKDSSSSTIATNSTRLNTDSKIYQARFTSGSWKGDLWAFGLDSLTGALTDANVPDWKASELIPLEASRSIFTHNGANGVIFEYANLGAKQAYINAVQVDYIRGNRSGEGVTVRNRDSLLGDIINSDPLYVSADNFNYYALELDGSGYATYDDYLEGTGSTEKGARQDMIYVGANDGMLHGLIAAGAVGSGGTACNVAAQDCEGEEEFAYIPKAVYNKSYDSNKGLADLASLNYGHQYFVDGAPKMGDAYIDFEGTGTARWGTALVGTLAGGGRGIFALDVSNPLNFSASDVLWDLDDSDTNMGDLGYTFSQPSIVKLNSDNGTDNNDWGVIVGNGYGSASGKAVLYILGLKTGEVIWKSEVETSSGVNGLSTPIAIDTDGDKIADTVYAGDLQGNMWKFDISDTSSTITNKWEVAITHRTGSTTYNDPLYKACTDDPCTDPQPITSKPQVVKATSGGVVVLFGTGKYFETGDNQDTSQVHTYYGIHDDGTNTAITGRSTLVQQEIVFEGAVTGLNYYVRATTDNNVDFSTDNGWYMNLINPAAYASGTNTGERVFANSLVRNGRVIFPTLIPEISACSFGGTSWLMEVDAQTGSRLSISAFDLNDDGSTDSGDYVKIDTDGDGQTDTWVPVSGKESTVGIIKTPTVISTGDDEKKYVSGTDGNIEVTTESGGDSLGRQSWQQLK